MICIYLLILILTPSDEDNTTYNDNRSYFKNEYNNNTHQNKRRYNKENMNDQYSKKYEYKYECTDEDIHKVKTKTKLIGNQSTQS